MLKVEASCHDGAVAVAPLAVAVARVICGRADGTAGRAMAAVLSAAVMLGGEYLPHASLRGSQTSRVLLFCNDSHSSQDPSKKRAKANEMACGSGKVSSPHLDVN